MNLKDPAIIAEILRGELYFNRAEGIMLGQRRYSYSSPPMPLAECLREMQATLTTWRNAGIRIQSAVTSKGDYLIDWLD